MIISRFLWTGRANASAAYWRQSGRANSAEGNVMKEVISELLQHKEQQEEDVYFESLNREIIEKLHRQAGTSSRSGTGPPGRVPRKNVRQANQGS
jgi:hypothetical protein